MTLASDAHTNVGATRESPLPGVVGSGRTIGRRLDSR